MHQRNFVCDHCWLVNYTGKLADFLPIDLSQEHNIKDIKVNHHSEGPSIDWKYLKKLHPAIHVVNSVASHIEKEFQTLVQGKKHTVPEKELDVQALQKSYHKARVHQYEPGRKVKRKNVVKDMATVGAVDMISGKTVNRWLDGRTFTRSMTQEWYLFSDSEESHTGNESDVSSG